MVKRAGGALLQSIAIDFSSARSISAQLCAALRELLLAGALGAGERLPATRTLAREIGIARSTVVEAFEQLASEGLIESRVGAGSFVSRALDTERPVARRTVAPRKVAPNEERLARRMAAAAGHFVGRLAHEPRPFTTAMPAFDAFPMAQWARLAAKHWRSPRHAALGYPAPAGHAPLRQAIAQHLRSNRGIACDGSQVFVLAGAQQAFQLIAGLLVDPGETVLFENPGAIGARNSFVLHGAAVVPVPVDEDGFDVEAGLRRAPGFRLAFVTPSHQQPLGAKMSLGRRFALLRAAESAGAWIVEDDWDGEFCFAGRPLAPLKSLDATGRVIYVGTFSKSLFPALRLGFILSPPALVPAFETALEAFSPGVPTSLQAIVAEFMAEGLFASHIRAMRRLYAERHAALLEAARAELADWLEVVPTNTGLHTVAWLRGRRTAGALAAAAAARGVTVTPISRFCIEPHAAEGVVLGFSGFAVPQIRAGVSALAAALAAMEGRPRAAE